MLKQWLYIGFVIFLVVIYQYSGRFFEKGENEILQAFNEMKLDLSESQLSIWGFYNKSYLNYKQKEKCIKDIAEKLNIEPQYDIKAHSQDGMKELRLIKTSKDANTTIKIVTLENKIEDDVEVLEAENYLIVDLVLSRDIKSTLYYKNIIEKILKDMGIKTQVNLNISGQKNKILTKEEQKNMVKDLLKQLKATKKEVFETNDNYSVYGYSSLISNYIVSNDKKVNLDIAFSYDEKENKTNIYIATPIITVDY